MMENTFRGLRIEELIEKGMRHRIDEDAGVVIWLRRGTQINSIFCVTKTEDLDKDEHASVHKILSDSKDEIKGDPLCVSVFRWYEQVSNEEMASQLKEQSVATGKSIVMSLEAHGKLPIPIRHSFGCPRNGIMDRSVMRALSVEIGRYIEVGEMNLGGRCPPVSCWLAVGENDTIGSGGWCGALSPLDEVRNLIEDEGICQVMIQAADAYIERHGRPAKGVGQVAIMRKAKTREMANWIARIVRDLGVWSRAYPDDNQWSYWVIS